MKRDRRLSIFEVGPALPETLEFFSSIKSRIYFADLYSDPVVLEGRGELSEDELFEQFSASLIIPPGEQFDLCLLWDFPNYLDDVSLRAFSRALKPYLHARSRAHAFAVRTSDTRIGNQWYGIDQPHLFTVRKPWIRQDRIHPHSQAILINLLTCFDIDRGMLLPDGRLEVVMTSSRVAR